MAALVVGAVPYFHDRRDRVVAPAARHAILAIHERGELVVASRSMSYGTSLAWTYSQIGICTGRILRGENSADPPVVQAIGFELVIKLETARLLGIDVPAALSAGADEVVE